MGVLAHPGSKQSMPLDSQWVVSYRCVIHYDAIFLTVSELYGLPKRIAGHRMNKNGCHSAILDRNMPVMELVRDFHTIIVVTKFGEVSSKTVGSIVFAFFWGTFSKSSKKDFYTETKYFFQEID